MPLLISTYLMLASVNAASDQYSINPCPIAQGILNASSETPDKSEPEYVEAAKQIINQCDQ